MNNLRIKFIEVLNKFCFSKHHDHDCSGCMFKNCEKCPLNTVVEKLEKSL